MEPTSISVSPKRKVVDCFTFYNELQLLNYRLHLLDPVVDYFVLAEATHTHSGKEKELFFIKHKEMFSPFLHKIIHLVIDDFPHKYPNIDTTKDEQWVNERFQRNALTRGIDQLALADTDLIMVSDLDEIPDPRVIHHIVANGLVVDKLQFHMDLYYYSLHYKQPNEWYKSKMISYLIYKYCRKNDITLDNLRINGLFGGVKCGWHLSYFGDNEFIHNKLVNFSHQEYNREQYTNRESIARRIKSGINLFDNRAFTHTAVEDNEYLPPEYETYLGEFYSLSSHT